jgi:SagB-type dehydrogenase family enzyme
MRTAARWVAVIFVVAILLGPARRQTTPQPAPAPQISLPEPRKDGGMSVEAAIAARRSVREFSDARLTWAEIGQLAWAAQGITDPAGRLRAAPSAGALYPLELYFVTLDGAYHYLPAGHKMEQLSDRDLRGELRSAGANQEVVGRAPLTIVIAAVYERTAVRYGERAQRYVHIETGHVGENILLQAKALGLDSVPMGAFRDGEVARVLSLPAECTPVYLIAVGHAGTRSASRDRETASGEGDGR